MKYQWTTEKNQQFLQFDYYLMVTGTINFFLKAPHTVSNQTQNLSQFLATEHHYFNVIKHSSLWRNVLILSSQIFKLTERMQSALTYV